MKKKSDQQEYLRFISGLSSLLSEVTAEDLLEFRQFARRGYPDLLPVLDGCLRMMRHSNRPVVGSTLLPSTRRSRQEHLFDLLRSKDHFPTNSALASFATRILPGITRKRFDKMSKADIAGQIIEYIEKFPARKQEQLSSLIRESIASKLDSRSAGEQDSFFSKWESIIKGLEY